MFDNSHWAAQLSWIFYTCSHNFRLLFMALTLPCDWSEHTLQWHNLHAWPCSSRIRHISLLQHTSKLLIFLSLHLSEMKQLGLLIAQGQEDKVGCTSNVRGRLPSQVAQESDRNEQCWACAYRYSFPLQSPPCALREHSLFPVEPRDEEESDSVVM